MYRTVPKDVGKSCARRKFAQVESQVNLIMLRGNKSDVVDEETQATIRAELSEMSFEELQKLKETLGTKVVNSTLFGHNEARNNNFKSFTRENKNRPRELSSRHAVSRFRQVIPVKEKKSRDPRFDDLSGEYNETIFKNSYKFLNEVKQKEFQQVQKAAKVTKDPKKSKELNALLQKMKSEVRDEKKKEVAREKGKEWREEQVDRIRQGKGIFYTKKSERRREELTERFNNLKKSGKLDFYMKHRRKKNDTKQRKDIF